MVYAADLGSVATSVEVRILSKAVHLIIQKSILPHSTIGQIRASGAGFS